MESPAGAGISGKGCGIGGWLMLKLGDLVDGKGRVSSFRLGSQVKREKERRRAVHSR